MKQIVHDCSKNRSVKRTELGVGGEWRDGVEVKLLGARHRGTGEQSNWGGRPRGYVVGELGPSRERVGRGWSGWSGGGKR